MHLVKSSYDVRHFSYITKLKKKHPVLKFIFPLVASGDMTQEAYIDIGRVMVFEASTLTASYQSRVGGYLTTYQATNH
jgi:hypothetical protein